MTGRSTQTLGHREGVPRLKARLQKSFGEDIREPLRRPAFRGF
ncbi:hypothetical protein [Caproiciproducens faecalis]|nr:hypothetical protein [Caproiciproducens faecalis]